MAFSTKELAAPLPVVPSENGWVVVIACGPQSVLAAGCGTGTETRRAPLDSAHGLKTSRDLEVLKDAMDRLLKKIGTLEP